MIRVGFFDSEPASLRRLTRCLVVDERVWIDRGNRFNSSEELLKWLRTFPLSVDIVLVDTQFQSTWWTLAGLVAEIKRIRPNCAVICLTQYAVDSVVEAAIKANADGILHKQDVGYGIASVLLHVRPHTFLYSPRLEKAVRRHARDLRFAKKIPAWRMYTQMRPALAELAEILFVEGLSAEMAAEELQLQKSAIAPMKYQANAKIQEAIDLDWYDLSWKKTVRTTDWSKTKLNYHVLTSLPRH